MRTTMQPGGGSDGAYTLEAESIFVVVLQGQLSLEVGGETTEHYHIEAEEIYYLTAGSGRLRVGEEEANVRAGDCVVFAPGAAHKLWNTGDEVLTLLCCCSPPYRHDDTVLLDA